MTAAVDRYVRPRIGKAPRYLELLHGNFLALTEKVRVRFGRKLVASARQATDDDLALLLDGEWRSRLTAAWLIGVDHRTQFRERLGMMLLESELVYSGQGYCFALARFADEASAGHLVTYLDRYLPDPQCYYNQDWAMGALLHLDAQMGTDRARRFFEPSGLWVGSAFGRLDPAELKAQIDALCSFVDSVSS
ncbi:DUF6000 family protein [Microbispora sp. NPDC049125]|uniref:DUF6000 family protein n=1 Tax=Microbispora sp. NPDC049125 TaxID=3154929 RepID=UPI003466F806